MTIDRVLFSVLCICLAGCGSSEEPTFHVSGTANYDGKPIPAGIIYFDPDPMKGGKGPQGFANIHDGAYKTAQGIRGGAYSVRITGYDGKPASEAPLGKTLFVEQEMKKELPAADSELNFDIPKTPR